MYDTPQSPPRKSGWTIHVSFLLFNSEKPYHVQKPVDFAVSDASPTTETHGVSQTFRKKLADLESKYQHGSVSQQLFQHQSPSPPSSSNVDTSAAGKTQNQQQQEEEVMSRERKEEKITVSSLLNKKTNERIELGEDSTVFDLKEAIAQHCSIAKIYTDTFALVFDRQTLPDWPSLNPKTLAELNLYDNALVFAVEFDKEQYNLRETLATRLVSQAKDQRRRRLECAFGLSQDCLQSAKGFTTLVDESAYPPLCFVPSDVPSSPRGRRRNNNLIMNNRPSTSNYALQQQSSSSSPRHARGAAFRTDLNRSELFEEEGEEKHKNSGINHSHQRPYTAATANGAQPSSTKSFLPSISAARGFSPSSTTMTNLELSSPRLSRLRAEQQQQQFADRDFTPSAAAIMWNPGSDRLFMKKHAFRGEDRERRYREYHSESATRTPEQMMKSSRSNAVSDDWLVGKATCDIE